MLSRRTLVAGTVIGAVAATAAGEFAVQQSRDAEPAAPPATDAQGRLLWRNWSGIQSSYPAVRAAPASLDELASLLKSAAAPIRVVGAGHSFTALVPTDGTLVSLDALSGIAAHDDTKLQATIRTGTRLGPLGGDLAGIGQEMLTLPDINKQSLGGAIATGTHGTGQTLQAIHGAITSFRIVTTRGDVIDASATQNADIFNAARVGLGAFGVITDVTLQNRKLTRIRKRVYAVPTRDALAAWPTLKQQHRNCELYILPFTDMTAVITADATNDPVVPRGPDTDVDTVMDLKAIRDWLGIIPPLRRAVARAAISSVGASAAVDDGWKLLSNERPIRFNEMEFHVPAEAQAGAALEVLTAIEAARPDVFFPFELRSIAADDAWLSPFYQRDSGSIAVHAYYKNDYSFLFSIVEPILRRHGGRPHWGKLNTLTAGDFAAAYPRWKDALAVRQSLDPDGKLLNPYLRRILLNG
jgi:FAD-linked oxidoreductase